MPTRLMRLRHSRGFSLLELAVVLIVLLVLMGLLGNRLLYYREEAERVEVQTTVANMRTALYARAAATRSTGELAALAEVNPLQLLNRIPTNYIGEYYSPDIESLPKGSWVYDKSDRSLIYLLNNPNFFADRKLNFLKFKVKFFRLPQNNAKPSDAPAKSEGVVLTQVDVPIAPTAR